MPKDEEVRQAAFASGKKLVEVGYLKTGESSWRRDFLYPEDLKPLNPAGDTANMLDPKCFIYISYRLSGVK